MRNTSSDKTAVTFNDTSSRIQLTEHILVSVLCGIASERATYLLNLPINPPSDRHLLRRARHLFLEQALKLVSDS